MTIFIRLFVPFVLLLIVPERSVSQLYFPPVEGDTWETVSFEELDWNKEKLDTLLSYIEHNDSKAFIVLKNGRIAIEWYQEGFAKSDLWYWASAGKTVTATLVGIAQAEGALDISESSAKYLGEGWTSLSPEDESRITIWNQLTMTSGLDDRNGDAFCTNPECLVYKANPGTRWAYHNAPYTLLDGVVAGATKQTLNQYYTEKLASKIGMNGLFFRSGFNNVLTSTPRSMARFGLLALNGFVWDGVPILDDKEYVSSMTTRSQEINKSYGYLWWLNGQETYMLPGLQFAIRGPITPNAPSDTYNGLGKNDQILSVVPSEGLVVVRMGDAASSDGPQVPTTFPNEMWALLQDVMRTTTSVSEDHSTNGPALIIQQGPSEVVVTSGVGPYVLTSLNGELAVQSTSSTVSLQGISTGVYFLTDVSSGRSVKIIR